MKYLISILFFWCILFTSPVRAQQCTLHPECGPGYLCDEGRCKLLESIFPTGGGRLFWVDQVRGSDQNPGTRVLPWQSIDRAHQAGQLVSGDAVVVRAGLYREAIRPPVSGITYVAYPGEQVVISGADEVNTGWSLHSGSIYKHPYTNSLDASCPWQNCGGIFWKRDMLIVDGRLMKPVASLDALEPGSFYVDGAPPSVAPTTMYAVFPGSRTPESFEIEWGSRSQLFAPSNESATCNASGMGGYRVIGFIFRYAVNKFQTGAICPGKSGSSFESNTIEWANTGGFRCTNSNHTFRGNIAQDNGETGIGGGCDDSVIEYNQSLRNGWKSDLGLIWGHELGGGKWSKTSGNVIRYHLAKDNYGPGIWFDIDNTNNVVENSRLIGNRGAGIMLELRTTQTTIRNNIIFGTRWDRWSGSGILSQASSYNTIVNNTIFGNEGTGIWIRRDANNRAPEGHNRIFNNVLLNNATTGEVGATAYEIYVCSSDNEMNGNLYGSHAGLSHYAFYFGPQSWRGNDVSAWRQKTTQDAGSQLVTTLSSVIQNTASMDGWRLSPTSPALAGGVSLPAGIEVAIDYEGETRPAGFLDTGADQVSRGAQLVTQNLVLRQGWNLISRSVEPSNKSLTSIFSGILGDIVLVKNNAGQVFSPDYGINMIGDWNSMEGYMIYTRREVTLSITGTPIVPQSMTIPLKAGWNLIPYLSTANRTVSTSVGTILPALVIMKNNSGQVFSPRYQIDTIGQLVPGQGYRVYLEQQKNLVYPAE